MKSRIDSVEPPAALPGGEVTLQGCGFLSPGGELPQVNVAGMGSSIVVAAANTLIARVPEGAVSGPVEVRPGTADSAASRPLEVGVMIAENLHPVCNPALDRDGNIVVTLSGARGQKTPVSLFRLDANYALKPWSGAVTNPSGLAFDRDGTLFVSSRNDGAVYRLAPNGAAAPYCESLGVATGIAFDGNGDLYVGDRSGTIFKIDSHRKTFVFATLEPSVAAYHLAFGPDRYLYVTGPTTSSFDTVWRVSPAGRVEAFFRGLGRPQGLAFDAEGSLLAVASLRGRRGVVRIAADGEAALAVSGNNLVGLAFARGPALIVASHNALFHLAWPTPGFPLLPGVPV